MLQWMIHQFFKPNNRNIIRLFQTYIAAKQTDDVLIIAWKQNKEHNLNEHTDTNENENYTNQENFYELIQKEDSRSKAIIEILQQLEKASNQRVTSLHLKFILDVNDQLWIVDWINAELWETDEPQVNHNEDYKIFLIPNEGNKSISRNYNRSESKLQSLPRISRLQQSSPMKTKTISRKQLFSPQKTDKRWFEQKLCKVIKQPKENIKKHDLIYRATNARIIQQFNKFRFEK